MTLLFLNEGAGDGYRPEYRCACYAVEQGQAARPKAAAEAEGDLGDPNSAATGSSSPGACAVQPRHRQQAARVRFRRTSRPRCGPGQSCRHPRDCYAEKTQRPVQFEITEQTREAVGIEVDDALEIAEQTEV